MLRATGEPARIFVSHSHEDNVWCRAFMTALSRAGADVWYDERDMEPGRLDDVIVPELQARPIFIVVLSPSAVASQWVQREVEAAIRLQNEDATRTILPVLAAKCTAPDTWNAYWHLSAPRDRPLLPLQAAARAVEVLNKRRGLALHTVASPAITDLYDTEHGTLLIHMSRSFVIAACLTGIAAFLVTGFLGFRDLEAMRASSPYFEPDWSRSIFHQPWPLYLWFCALIVTLEASILRHPALRRQLAAMLVVTSVCIGLVGVIYFYNVDINNLRLNLLNALVGTNHFLRPVLEAQQWTFTLLNFAVIGGFWLSMLYRWRRRARHLPLRLAVNIGPEETVDVATTEPDLPRLIGGDLVFLSVVVAILAFLLRADVITALIGRGYVNTCAVTLPGTGCVSPGDAGSATTLTHIDTYQALVYFSVGFVLIMGWAFTRRLHGEVERDDVVERLWNALLDFLIAVREAFVRSVPRFLGPALALRLLVWIPLVLLSTISVATTAHYIQRYLHLLSDSKTCTSSANCLDYLGNASFPPVRDLLASGAQYQAAVLALLYCGIAYLAVVTAIAIQLLHWRVIANTTRLMRALVPVVLPWLWVFPLALSAANALVSVADLSQRAPFPQPDLVTIVLLAVGGLSVAPRVVRRVRSRRQVRNKPPG
jgi:hypothetical protein